MQRRQAIGFAIFCLLSGSSWLADNAFPSSLPPLERQSLHYFAIGLAVFVFTLLRPRSGKLTQPSLLPIAEAAILLLGLPSILNEAAFIVSARSGIALYALVPLFLIVAAAAFNSAATGQQPGRALMMPALVGFGGTLLLPAFYLPATTRDGLLFVVIFVAVLLTAAGSLQMHTILRGCAFLPAVFALCGVNALVLGAAALFYNPVMPQINALPSELLRSFLLDLPQLILLVWLLREVDPVRFASRFVLVPLLFTLEGIAVLRPPVDLRLILAVLLMAAGGGALLLANPRDESDAPSQLNLL